MDGPTDLTAHIEFAHRLAFALVRDEHAAEDVAQDALAIAVRHGDDARKSTRVWLGGVVRNVARMKFRSAARRRRHETAAALRTDVSSPAARAEALRSLARALATLEEPYRETVILRYYDELPPSEISRRMGIPVKTVKSRLYRGLGMLRARLDRDHGGDRRAWSLLLLPAGGRRESAGAIAAGGLVVGIKLKIGAAVAALALGITAFFALSVPPGAPPPEESEVARSDVPALTEAPPVEGPDPSSRSVAVHGLVLDVETGGPVASADVRVTTPDGVIAARTDARGRWELALPPTDDLPDSHTYIVPTHVFRVQAESYSTRALRVRVPPDRDRFPAATAWLSRVAARLYLRVTDARGAPVGGAVAHVLLPGLASEEGACTVRHVAGADGRIGPLRSGAGHVRIVTRGPAAPDLETRLFVEPGPARDLPVPIVLPDPLWTQGEVVDVEGRPVPGVRIVPHIERARSITTDSRGKFRWPAGQGTTSRVRLEKEGWLPPLREVEIIPGIDARFVMRRAATVEGRLLEPDGSPAPAGIAVYAVGSFTTTRTGGRFRLPSVRPGRTRIFFRNGPIFVHIAELELEPGDRRSGIDFRCETGDGHPLIVTDAATGAPIEGARIGLAVPGFAFTDLATDEQGRFEIPLLGGAAVAEYARPTDIMVTAEGYLRRRVRIDWDHRPLEVRLAPTGAVRLRVVDAKGRPVPGAYTIVKWCLAAADPNHEMWTGPDGEIEIEGVPEQPIRLWIEHHLAGTAYVDVSGTPGRTTERTVALRPHRGTTITVVDEEGRPIADAYADLGGAKLPTLPILRADAEGRIHVPWGSIGGIRIGAPGLWRRAPTPRRRDIDGKVVLRRGAPLLGRVLDHAGRPCASLLVYGGGGATMTDGEGRFRIDGCRQGQRAQVQVWEPNLTAILKAGDPEKVLTLPGTAQIEVRADTGLEHGEVRVVLLDRTDVDRGTPARARSLASPAPGGFRIPVPGEPIELWFRSNGAFRVWSFPDLRPGETRRVEYEAAPEGSLTGRVVDYEGRPVAGARIGAWPAQIDELESRHGGFAKTNADGLIEVTRRRDVPAATVRLLVRSEGRPPFLTDPVDLAESPEIRVAFVRGVRVTGTVAGPRGKIRAIQLPGVPGRWANLDGAGRFRLGDTVAPGLRRFEIRQDGRMPRFEEALVPDVPAYELKFRDD